MAFRNWIIKKVTKDSVLKLSKELNIPNVTAAILCSRGLDTPEKASVFIGDDVEKTSEKKWYGMEKCVNAVKNAIDEKKKICIYGDYDADGVTATALMYDYLSSKGAEVSYYIPERDRDGYGLNNRAIDLLNSQGIEYIITVDNGISAYNEIEYANSLGMSVIVTDHHKIPPMLPNAKAVIDPHIPENGELGETNFAGVGVVLKMIENCERGNLNFDIEKYMDLVAIGTVGDAIELCGETRSVVKSGLNRLESSERIGIRILLERLNLKDKKFDGIDIAFSVVPKINACGRMNRAEIALKLLLSTNEEEANLLCDQVLECNMQRKEIEEQIISEVEDTLRKDEKILMQKIIIAYGHNWHHGVLGIVASKISEKYGKPCILITIDGDEATGSCRSVDGFSIYNVVANCSELLERFGGHTMAAGFNMKSCKIEDFKNKILQACEDTSMPPGELKIDVCLNPSKISTEIFDALDIIRPFGKGNAEPIFGIIGACVVSVRPIGGGKHLKICFEKNGYIFDALYFNKSIGEFFYYEGEKVDLAIKLSPNTYRGVLSASIFILDIRFSGYNFINAIVQKGVYEKFRLDKQLSEEEKNIIRLNREDIAKVYRYFKIMEGNACRADVLSKRVFENNCNIAKIYIIMDILEELDLANISQNGDDFMININQTVKKVDLNSSAVFRKMNSITGGNRDGAGT